MKCLCTFFSMGIILQDTLASWIFSSSLCLYSFVFLSLFCSLVRAEECTAYSDRKARIHDSFTCPKYCCGNAFAKYCCDDPSKRNIVKHFETLSTPDWFVAALLALVFFGMSFLCVYTVCFLFRGDHPRSRSRKTSVSRESTSATAISIEDIGEEHGGSNNKSSTTAPSVPDHVLPVAPPYSQPSAKPPPYSWGQSQS